MSTRTPPPGAKPNRLANSASPYLLQHRFNPVDWRPWGDDAFQEARRRDVPIFLSVGYSTCYWCHVMERECFENDQIAEAMNRDFVCIKVDREERPDVDDIYMASVQAFTQRGGWPMSVFLEPSGLQPFYSGTYFPPTPKYPGMPSFPDLLESMARAWREQRADVLAQAQALAEAVRERVVQAGAPERLDESLVARAASQLLRMHDRVHGGFGPAPKFPQPVYLELLLSVRQVASDIDTRVAIDAAMTRTLDAMAVGGMFDQVGGGFHRYSVDERWVVPHFEKMLYDNAQLLSIYAKASALYDDALYQRTASRIVDYVLRELRSPGSGGGAFFSAQDAEVNHREGQNYLWTPEQIRRALAPAEAEWLLGAYGVSSGPNFRDPHHADESPSNVLVLATPIPVGASRSLQTDDRTLPDLFERFDRANTRLLAVRAERDQPATDTKILAGWNGLMIGALAEASILLDDTRAREAAMSAAACVLANMRKPDGTLMRSYAQGRADIPGVLEDYALLAHGLVQLSRACKHAGEADAAWLGAARDLVAVADRIMGNPSTGGWFDTPAGRSDLFVRPCSAYDGAVPSGTGIMIDTLIDLSEITGESFWLDRAVRGLVSISAYVAQAPLGACVSTRALLRLLQLDRSLLDRAFADISDAAPEHDRADIPDFQPVEILSQVDTVEVGPDQPAGLTLRLRIAPGYHITAADPGDSPAARELVPLRLHVVGGEGIAAYADYPAGTPLGRDEQRVLVYAGELDIPVVVERVGQWKGRPLLAITFQACTDRSCLAPRTVELDVAVDRA